MEPDFAWRVLVRREVRQPCRGLRLAVHDEQLHQLLGGQQFLDQHRWELSASLLDQPQRRERPLCERAGPEQKLERRGDARQYGALLPVEQVEGRLREGERVAQHDAAPAPQVSVQQRGAVAVEEGEDDQHPVIAPQFQEPDDRVGVRLDIAVRHPHGLRPGGRPGGEHEDGIGIRVDRGRAGPIGLPAGPEDLLGKDHAAVVEGHGEPAQRTPVREDGRAPGDVRVTADVAGGELVGKRHGDMTELHHGQVGRHPEERVRAEHADPGSGGQVQRREFGGQLPGGGTQLPVGVPLTGVHHRHAIRRALRQQVIAGVRAIPHGHHLPLADRGRHPHRHRSSVRAAHAILGRLARGQAACS